VLHNPYSLLFQFLYSLLAAGLVHLEFLHNQIGSLDLVGELLHSRSVVFAGLFKFLYSLLAAGVILLKPFVDMHSLRMLPLIVEA